MADKRGLLSGEHFSVDGTLIQAWASHKSMRRKDGSDDGRPPEDWRGEPRSNDTHESTTRSRSRGCTARATRRRRCRATWVMCSPTTATAWWSTCRPALPTELPNATWRRRCWPTSPRRGKRITVGADKAYDTKGFVKACRDINVTPHVAQNTNRNGGSAIDARTTRHVGYEISQRKRKCIEQCFGWGKVIGPIRQVMVQGLDKVDQLLTLTMAAYNLTRLRTLVNLRPQCVQ